MPIINPGGTFTPYSMSFIVDLPNFPEWAIPCTKLIPRVYSEDGYDLTNLTTNEISTYFKYWWKYVDANHWQIYVTMQMLISIGGNYIPTFVDVDLVILNEQVWEENNPDKR